MSTGMILDGVLGSEAIDSTGEVLDVAGADISDVDKGTMALNWEHQPGEKGASTIVGIVLRAKKIFSRSDCDNERQRMYWDEIKLPYIYGVCRLYDGAGHEEAKRIASIIRDHAANKEPIICRYSVEGATLNKEDNRLKESVIRRVAVTVKPANRTAVSGLIEDPNAPAGFEKKHDKVKTRDLLDFSDASKSETDPMFQRLGASWGMVVNPLVDDMAKALTAGTTGAAPSALTGGAALQKEDLGPKKPGKAKVWTTGEVIQKLSEGGYMEKSFNRTEFRGFAKTLMPEASDDFLDHFTDVLEDYHVKRSQLQKKEEGAAEPAPKEPKAAAPKPAAKTAGPKPAKTAAPKVSQPKKVDEPDNNPIRLSVASIRGVPVAQPKIKSNKWVLDEEKGILHTRKGSFPLYNPDKGFDVKEHPIAKLSPFYHNGTLHVAPGTDMSKVPHNGPNPEFAKMLETPEIKDFIRGQVLPGFIRNKENLQAGTLPDDIVKISYLMSAMSPNTPVSVQQGMEGHLYDSWQESGIDPADPEFRKLRKDWKSRDQKDRLPEHDREIYAADNGMFLGGDSEKGGRRKAGDVKSFMLANNKFDNVAQYHKLHPTMMELIKKHGTDARAATAELMQHKVKEIQWKNQRNALKKKVKAQALAAGLTDDHRAYVEQKMAEAHAAGKFQKKGEQAPEREPGADDDDEAPLPFDPRMLGGNDDEDFSPGEFMAHPSIAKYSPQRPTGKAFYRAKFKQEATDQGLQDKLTPFVNSAIKTKFPQYNGTPVPGLAPKTGRYAFLLSGGSNAAVHDTHYVRHMFGMDAGKDGRTLMYLKSGLWRAGNHHILEAMDRWYAKNHPAPRSIAQDPIAGKHFKDNEDAVGPGFWLHWATIPRDEKSRGLDTSQSQNELSTHSAMWKQMERVYGSEPPELKKHAFSPEMDDHMMGKLCALFLSYQQQFGEIPAMMMYYKHIVPHLYEMSEYRTKHDDLSDFAKNIPHLENLGIQLRKNAHDMEVAKISDPNVPTVHTVYYKDKDHDNSEHVAGRFALYQGNVHHIEDYHGLIAATLPQGPLTMEGLTKLHGLKMSPHVRVTTETIDAQHPSYREPAHPEAMQQKSRLPRPPSVFEYTRAGHDKPHTLEVKDGNYMLDGKKMDHDEVKTILANHKSGAAKLRYKAKPKGQFDAIQKAEHAFEALMKADPDFNHHELLQYIRDAEAKGTMPKGSGAAATKHLFADTLVPSVGNQVALADHLKRNPAAPGAFVQMDGNDFRMINEKFGHSGGDSAIKSFGQAAREAMDETVGQQNGKLWRNGGDEFVAHVPSHEHAAQFSRALSDKLNAMPPIGGTHKMSMAFGFGPDIHSADKALYEAKKQKIEAPGLARQVGQKLGIAGPKRKWKVGQVPNIAHSMMPGHEGPMPINDSGQTAVHAAVAPPTPSVERPLPKPPKPQAA